MTDGTKLLIVCLCALVAPCVPWLMSVVGLYLVGLYERWRGR